LINSIGTRGVTWGKKSPGKVRGASEEVEELRKGKNFREKRDRQTTGKTLYYALLKKRKTKVPGREIHQEIATRRTREKKA